MKKIHCDLLEEIKEIHIINNRMEPVFCRLFMYEHMYEKTRRKRYSCAIIKEKKEV